MKLLAQSLSIGDYTLQGPTHFAFEGSSIGTIISTSLSYVFAFAGIGLLLMIIASGFTLMTSVGDPKKLAKGRASLTNAIIGFVLIFAAFWIVQILGTIFGWTSIIRIFGQ